MAWRQLSEAGRRSCWGTHRRWTLSYVRWGRDSSGLGADEDALDSIPDAAISVMGRSEDVVESRYRLQMIETRNEDVLDQVVSYR